MPAKEAIAVPNIHQRLNRVRAAVSLIVKEEKTVNGQYRFVSHDAVVREARRALLDAGVSVVASVKAWHQDGNRTDCTLEVSFVNEDDPQDFVSVHYFAFGADNSDKGPGKCMSYALKYCLLKVLLLESGDEADNERFDIPFKRARGLSSQHLQSLREIMAEEACTDAEFCAAFKLKAVADLDPALLDEAIGWLKGEA